MPLAATPSRPVLLLAVPLAILSLGACSGGGAVADGGTDGAECPVGQVTFVLRGTSGAPGQYCVGAPSSCSDEWLSIVSPDTSALEIDRPCEADCSVCEPIGCPALCAAPTALQAGGVQRTWDGSGYRESRCGDALACVAPSCAPRGRYTAKMCAYAAMSSAGDAGLCSPVAAPTCVSVAFDWPPDGGQATVTGTIGGGADGGAHVARRASPSTRAHTPMAAPARRATIPPSVARARRPAAPAATRL